MTHALYCHFCRSRNVSALPDMLDPTCSVCLDALDKIALCPCGADADEVDGEVCLPCLADGVRSGEVSIEAMTGNLARRVLDHMRKTPEPRVPQLLVRQAS